ncbi:MAG: hypothetical protein RIT27_804 [Pseudomonadota bacterium]|jgi:hypothetical protein
MAQIKGKFITLTGALMSLYPEELAQADRVLFQKIKKHWDELDPESWYEISLFNLFMETYFSASPSKEKSFVTLGRKVYPTIKKTVGLPPISDPLVFLKFEAANFLTDHRGNDVKPRRILREQPGDFLVEAFAPGYNSKLYEGVFLGILEMCGVQDAKVIQTKCQEKGDDTSEFHITWKC